MAARRTRFPAIGTHWDIQVYDTVGSRAWNELLQAIHQRIESFDTAYSRFRSDSLVTHMSRQAGRHLLPPDAYPLLNFYEKLYKATSGRVTPLIGQIIADAGYDADYSFQPKALQPPAKWEDVLAYTKKSITLRQPVLLDFGAAGKGYLVDIVSGLLEAAGLQSYTINAGGDMLHRSEQQESLAVGMENPEDASEAIGIIDLKNKSLCASSGAKRKWGKYHHIIDPTRLESPQQVLATWVTANDTMTADGLATALFFTDAETLAKQFEFSYALLYPDMRLQYAHDFPAKIFEAV
jgi:thiamine biosynthesis lipoprotein